MKVLNIHSRIIDKPKHLVVKVFKTLSTKNDQIWPNEKWPAMIFKEGIQEGVHGGHGPIRYSVELYDPSHIIKFRFTKPKGFQGTHQLEIIALNGNQTEVKHTIDIQTTLFARMQWFFIIRPLHDALLEDCLDKIENNLCNISKFTKHNAWVKILRKILG